MLQTQQRRPHSIPSTVDKPRHQSDESMPISIEVIHLSSSGCDYQTSFFAFPKNDDDESFLSSFGNLATSSQNMSNSYIYQLNDVGLSCLNVESSSPASQKKTRSKITVERKIDIIRYHENNPGETPASIAKVFCLPRTTIIGVLKYKDTILSHANGPSKGYHRIVKARLLEVEVVLARWVDNQKSRGIPVSIKKICTQATEIHRAMSSCTNGGLRGCEYTTGWLKGFKRRHGAVLEMEPIQPSQVDKDFWQSQIDDYISKCKPEAVYFCYTTSMYLNMTPMVDMSATDNAARSVASVLLCCNAAGTDLLDPLVVYRNVLQDTKGEGSSEVDDLARSDIEQWLVDFDARASEPTLLLVDQSLCSSIASIVLAKRLKYILPISVPKSISPLLPMSTTLAKEFKALYKLCLLSTTPNQFQNLHEYRSYYIRYAWHQIQGSSIIRSVHNSQQAVNGLLKGNTSHNVRPPRDVKDTGVESGESAITQLQRVLEARFPGLQKHRYEYYTAQDGDTGPSPSICAHIQELLREG